MQRCDDMVLLGRGRGSIGHRQHTGSLFFGVFVGLLLGGSLSNAVESSMRGSITDYICLRFWPAFNLADLALAAGAIGILCGAPDCQYAQWSLEMRAGPPTGAMNAGFPRFFTIVGYSINSYKFFLCVGIYVGTLTTAALASRLRPLSIACRPRIDGLCARRIDRSACLSPARARSDLYETTLHQRAVGSERRRLQRLRRARSPLSRFPSLPQPGSTFLRPSCGTTWVPACSPAGSGSGLDACSTAVAWGESPERG